MELYDESLKVVIMGMNPEGIESKGTTDCEICSERELGDSRNMYCELEERTMMAEERCAVLEMEAQKTKNEFELLAGRFRALEVEKTAVEDELRDSKKMNGKLEEVINKFNNENAFATEKESGKGVMVDLTEDKDDEEKFQLMIENRVLDCEKKRAESEVEVWKSKCIELESRVLELQNSLVSRGGECSFSELLEMAAKEIKEASGLEDRLGVKTSLGHVQMEGNAAAGTFFIDTPMKKFKHVGGRKRGTCFEIEQGCGGLVRKQLEFGEGSPCKKIAPLTPGGARPSLGVIDISDSDDERDIEKKMTCNNKLKRTILDQSDEDEGGYNGNFSFTSTPKRKRASNIVTSDSESDDDNIPICKLKRKHLPEFYGDHTDSYLKSCLGTATVSGDEAVESVTPGRRLVRLRKCVVKDDPERLPPSNLEANEDVEDDEIDEDGSETEDESLSGFIVDGSDVSVDDDASGESEDVSDGNVDFEEILSKIRRNRDDKSKWEFEADMLAAFGKDPVLCMKAVCALYRQQTSEEKSSKGTIYANQRGFSQCDAFRGTTLAEFLTDVDPRGDLKKSVKELEEYDPKGLEVCRKLATHYSKQLFAIYKNKEDPLFLPD